MLSVRKITAVPHSAPYVIIETEHFLLCVQRQSISFSEAAPNATNLKQGNKMSFKYSSNSSNYIEVKKKKSQS